MSAMTHAFSGFCQRKHSLLTTATMIVLFWAVAAVLVATAHQRIDPISPVGCLTTKIIAIVLTAFAYTRLTARETTVDHALFVGVAWMLMAIAAGLLSPAKPFLHDVLMVAWIAAPALFARRR